MYWNNFLKDICFSLPFSLLLLFIQIFFFSFHSLKQLYQSYREYKTFPLKCNSTWWYHPGLMPFCSCPCDIVTHLADLSQSPDTSFNDHMKMYIEPIILAIVINIIHQIELLIVYSQSYEKSLNILIYKCWYIKLNCSVYSQS